MDTAINRQCAIIIGNEVLIGSQAAHWKLIVFSQKKSAIHTNFGIRKFQFSLIARFGLLNKQEKSTKTKKIPKWNGCSIDEFNTQIIMIENRISFQLSRPFESSAVLCCPMVSLGVFNTQPSVRYFSFPAITWAILCYRWFSVIQNTGFAGKCTKWEAEIAWNGQQSPLVAAKLQTIRWLM